MNELKFAVVREDADVEIEVVRRRGARRVLLVASGGCTAFALAHALPEVEIELFDANPHQLAHVRAKADAIARGDLRALGIDDDDSTNLSQRGAFERLFRVLRAAIDALVADAPSREAYFAGDRARADAWLASPYWPAVFASTFHDGLLVAMFGPDAVQHAPAGSYPRYFQRCFERGLLRADGPHNPFLQHVLLGRYLARDAFPHLTSGRRFAFPATLGTLLAVPDLARFDVVHLSNIFDWCDDATVARGCEALRGLRPGAVVIVRQLNNRRPLAPLLDAGFTVDAAWGDALCARDRSLFYERIVIATKAS